MTFEEWIYTLPVNRPMSHAEYNAAKYAWHSAKEAMREMAAVECEGTMGCENNTDYSHMPEGHYDLARKIRALPVE